MLAVDSPPSCRCGCARPVTWNRQYGRWNRWLKGHNPPGNKGPSDRPRATPAERSRRYRQRNPGIRRFEHLRRYNITRAQYEALEQKQGGRCAICRTGAPGSRRTLWCVDHDHRTGVVRGLLCFTCNVGIGAFKESRDVLVRAVAYMGGV